ncbi:hypothetical protein [Terrabacter sp. 2YAF2]|uniref:hypothetical protein n=1 Tax=Terrabacter sp. 2YAF2 TaxID=3233026 RepID=UPI003F9EADD4
MARSLVWNSWLSPSTTSRSSVSTKSGRMRRLPTRRRTCGTSRSPGTSSEMARITDSDAFAGRSRANHATSSAASRPRPGSRSAARISSAWVTIPDRRGVGDGEGLRA